ncbi:hypothetical protein LCGC14_0380470 [marine sediment metagenome]|uniref:Uncharacterized protein n=1 Tax=marine sediment metagenome TaxID=412755 RepID=A0A0F9VPP2_9ZZZZ
MVLKYTQTKTFIFPTIKKEISSNDIDNPINKFLLDHKIEAVAVDYEVLDGFVFAKLHWFVEFKKGKK